MTFLASDYAFWVTMTTLLVEGSNHLRGLSDYPKFVPRTTLSRGKARRAGSLDDIRRHIEGLARVGHGVELVPGGTSLMPGAHEAFPGLRESGSVLLVCCADEAVADPTGWPGCGRRRLERFSGQYCGRA